MLFFFWIFDLCKIVHYNWICFNPDEEVVENVLPYSILSAFQKGKFLSSCFSLFLSSTLDLINFEALIFMIFLCTNFYIIDWKSLHVMHMNASECNEYEISLKDQQRLSKSKMLHEMMAVCLNLF